MHIAMVLRYVCRVNMKVNVHRLPESVSLDDAVRVAA